MYLSLYISLSIYIYIYVCMYIYIYIYVCISLYIYIYIYIYTCIHTICFTHLVHFLKEIRTKKLPGTMCEPEETACKIHNNNITTTTTTNHIHTCFVFSERNGLWVWVSFTVLISRGLLGREAMLLLIETSRSVVNSGKIVPRIVCRQFLKPCLNNTCFCRLSIRNAL